MHRIRNTKLSLTIGYLYADLFNTYGDYGNIIAFKMRAHWRGIKVISKPISLGEKLPAKGIDIYFIGGGQNKAQDLVAEDLARKQKGLVLKKIINDGIPLLAICGGYQLLGEYYQPRDSEVMLGINIFPCHTVAGRQRMIGNIIIDSFCGTLAGFENHSGQTFLTDGALPFGKVLVGYGNNPEARYEGCCVNNAIGTYLHGSLLPKNPRLADWFLHKALEIKYHHVIKLTELNDAIENQAHHMMVEQLLGRRGIINK